MEVTKLVNKVSNPINPDMDEFIEYLYDIHNEDNKWAGRLRFEIFDNMLFVTPILIDNKPSNFKLLKSELYRIGAEVMDKFYYDIAFVYTKNKKMINLFDNGKLNFVELTKDGYYIYYINREDI